jgi:sulfur carrier protein
MITVNGEQMDWTEGMTVQELLDKKRFTFRMLSVWINDSAVPKKEFDTRTIPDGADVQVIHNISGG